MHYANMTHKNGHRVANITISVSTNSAKKRSWTVLHNSNQQIPATEDETRAREYARTLYHAEKGHARLLFYDGDIMDTDTLIESKLPAGARAS